MNERRKCEGEGKTGDFFKNFLFHYHDSSSYNRTGIGSFRNEMGMRYSEKLFKRLINGDEVGEVDVATVESCPVVVCGSSPPYRTLVGRQK